MKLQLKIVLFRFAINTLPTATAEESIVFINLYKNNDDKKTDHMN